MQKSPRAFRLRPQLKRPLAVASGGLTLGSRARFRPALCYVRWEVETAREATCPKVQDMENEVRRARRTSAPFGWKASGLQALPAGLFFLLLRSLGFACFVGLRRNPSKMRQNASAFHEAVQRSRAIYPSARGILCAEGREAERRCRKLCYRRPNDETAPGGPSGTVNASGRRSCPPETSRT